MTISVLEEKNNNISILLSSNSLLYQVCATIENPHRFNLLNHYNTTFPKWMGGKRYVFFIILILIFTYLFSLLSFEKNTNLIWIVFF